MRYFIFLSSLLFGLMSCSKTQPKRVAMNSIEFDNPEEPEYSYVESYENAPIDDYEPEQEQQSATGALNGHEWVDLGLSVKWAACNVGADTPSDNGEYYAWGETQPKSVYEWDNYFDCLDINENIWGIYKVVDNGLTSIAPDSGHDTARENWGGTWRMPTEEEWTELCRECDWVWTILNGYRGYLITGPNGNSIFLPPAGSREGSESYDIWVFGFYWSSTLCPTISRKAACLVLEKDYGGNYCLNYNRNRGHSVRPVTE